MKLSRDKMRAIEKEEEEEEGEGEGEEVEEQGLG